MCHNFSEFAIHIFFIISTREYKVSCIVQNGCIIRCLWLTLNYIFMIVILKILKLLQDMFVYLIQGGHMLTYSLEKIVV